MWLVFVWLWFQRQDCTKNPSFILLCCLVKVVYEKMSQIATTLFLFSKEEHLFQTFPTNGKSQLHSKTNPYPISNRWMHVHTYYEWLICLHSCLISHITWGKNYIPLSSYTRVCDSPTWLCNLKIAHKQSPT